MLPKQKLSRAKTRSRRGHDHLAVANYTDCPQCNQAKLPHAACENCGYVRPRLKLNVEKES
jgi:large subunit ribosomal protein L32